MGTLFFPPRQKQWLLIPLWQTARTLFQATVARKGVIPYFALARIATSGPGKKKRRARRVFP